MLRTIKPLSARASPCTSPAAQQETRHQKHAYTPTQRAVLNMDP